MIKWSKKARRFFLYSFTGIKKATAVVIHDKSNIINPHLDKIHDIIPLSRVTIINPFDSRTKSIIVSV